jgi:hypothetical protein
MFKTASARYVLRAAVAAVLAASGAILAATTDNTITLHEWALIVVALVGGFAAYAGIGAASGSVEPFVGRKQENTEVPMPPADPVPPS